MKEKERETDREGMKVNDRDIEKERDGKRHTLREGMKQKERENEREGQ